MAFVPVDGATDFAVGAVAKSAPLIQTDLNVDQLAASMSEGISEITEDFETGDFSLLPWQRPTPPASWAISATSPHTGSWNMESGGILENEISTINFSKTVGDGTFSFWYRIDTSFNGWLIFYINGILFLGSNVNVGWTQFTTTLTAGSYNFKWEFTRGAGAGTVWVDDIVIPGQAVGGISDLHRHQGGDGGKPVRRWPMNPHGKGFGSGSSLSKTHGLWRLYESTFQRTIDTLGATITEVAQVSDGFWIPNGAKELRMFSSHVRPPSGTTFSVAIGISEYADTVANPYDVNHYTNKSSFFNNIRSPFDIPLTIDSSLYGKFVRLAILLRVKTTVGPSTFFFWNSLNFGHQHRFSI